MSQEIFRDRQQAGIKLAHMLKAYAGRQDLVVFGLARGGVPVAHEVARALNAPLEVIVVRKIGVPGQAELAMGAIAPDNLCVFNAPIVSSLNISEADLAKIERSQRQELIRRELLYRNKRPYPDLSQKTAFIVDDGLATGATMRAAIAWIKNKVPAHIIVAAPVASASACRLVEGEGCACICAWRLEDFYAVGAYYHDFQQVSDQEVLKQLVLP
ncbi:MAG: phosphoribosyltransferase [Oligoflexia bacterium]|nr:phosphoribosyltransferase [Oligoflexia bacterium]